MATDENTPKTSAIIINQGKIALQGVVCFCIIVGCIGGLATGVQGLPSLVLHTWDSFMGLLSYNHTIFWLPAALAILFAALALMTLGVAHAVARSSWYWWTTFGFFVFMFYMSVFAMNGALPKCADIHYGVTYGFGCEPFKGVMSDAINLFAITPCTIFVVIFVRLLLGKT